VGSFSDTFWAGISENKALTSYVRRLRKTLSDHGIPFDKKRFNPHITLVRRAAYANGLPPVSVSEKEMRVERISLMRSERGKHGMIYTEVGCV
jgi:2'-5' RNA ligase